MVFRLIYAFVLALGIGYLTARAQLGALATKNMPHYGPWMSAVWLAETTEISDIPDKLYLRAAHALAQGLPEDQTEILTFEAVATSAGEPLLRSCAYRVEGPATNVAWWSLQGMVGGVPVGPGLNPGRVGAAANAPFHFTLGANTDEDSEPFALVLRLYRADEAFVQTIGPQTLPTITKEVCQ